MKVWAQECTAVPAGSLPGGSPGPRALQGAKQDSGLRGPRRRRWGSAAAPAAPALLSLSQGLAGMQVGLSSHPEEEASDTLHPTPCTLRGGPCLGARPLRIFSHKA